MNRNDYQRNYRKEKPHIVLAIEERSRNKNRNVINERARNRYKSLKEQDPVAVSKYNHESYLRRVGRGLKKKKDNDLVKNQDDKDIKRIKRVFQKKGVWKDG